MVGHTLIDCQPNRIVLDGNRLKAQKMTMAESRGKHLLLHFLATSFYILILAEKDAGGFTPSQPPALRPTRYSYPPNIPMVR